MINNSNELLTKILKNRNYNDTEIDHILYNKHLSIQSPYELNNADVAAEAIFNTINDNHYIYIFADYDVDGLMSGYILFNIISDIIGYDKVFIHYPNRINGYGLNMSFCNKLIINKNQDENITVITVDNGIACVKEIELLKNNNINTIVLDHHEAKNIEPDCIICNPHSIKYRSDNYSYLAGCGVVFKVCQILLEKYDIFNMLDYTPYVALGTLADIMPLSEENIALIRYGIDIMNTNPDFNIGLHELLDYCGLLNNVTPNDLSFEIIPKLNACGRMNDIMLAYNLISTENKSDAENIINNIVILNDKRKKLTKNVDEFISEYKKNNGDTKYCFLSVPNEYSGICGIAATKAIESGYSVAFVYTTDNDNDSIVGSARSNDYYDIQDLFNHVINDISFFGGHKRAGGFSLNIENHDNWKNNISSYIDSIIIDSSDITDTNSELFYDEEISLTDVSYNTYNMFSFLPFETEPIFKVSNLYCFNKHSSKNNNKNIEYAFKDEKSRILRVWIWNHDSYNILNTKINLYGSICKDFRNPKFCTMKIKYLENW